MNRRTLLVSLFWLLIMMPGLSLSAFNGHVAIVSSTFSGHVNVMLAIAKELNAANIRVSFYLSSFTTLSEQNHTVMNRIATLPKSSVVDLSAHYIDLPPLDPLERLPIQTAALLEPIKIAFDRDPADVIIFDMLALEGKLIGLMTDTPTIAIGAAFEVPKRFAKSVDVFHQHREHLHTIFQFSGLRLEEHVIAGAALPFVFGDETYSLTLPELHQSITDKISDCEGKIVHHIGP